ncbi:MAG: ATP-dependent sacrificial sulfur transferase LarE [Phycisphaerae bacterium]|nr:ATP-dependent sacrificial sulfur transferase LarE [Phycisphaerae bacterium]
MNAEPRDKLAKLRACLRKLESVLVAFSGGLDSAVLLKVAVDTLDAAHVLAVTGRSPALPQAELHGVARLAAELGARHEFIDTREFEDPNYTSNPVDRCYHCKNELYVRLADTARVYGLGAVIDGGNADDPGDFRPGMNAAREHGVLSPLMDAGLSKPEIRALAAALGLSIHDKPASPCLSSRVQYGESIDPDKLRRIDAAETFLRELGFRECRVRHHDKIARIEVPANEIARFADADLRQRVDGRLREIGYQYVSLDLRGFRSGSLNEVHLGGRSDEAT